MTSYFHQLQKASFFEQCWHKKPHFSASACDIAHLASSITPQKLLTLARNELVESRLLDLDHYDLAFGPFNLEAVPENSLLMIQGLDQHSEEINRLLAKVFSFLPRWRLEDVMATLGLTGAHCGAHFDHYDVFLIQISGSKDWALDEGGHTEFELNPDVDIRLLSEFSPTRNYRANPGDVLYIPPGVGHWGIAGGESMTLSVGLRNPTMAELISHLADTVGDSMTARTVFNQSIDPGNSGIPITDIESLGNKLAAELLNPEGLADWYGSYMTEPKEPELIPEGQSLTLDELTKLLTGDHELVCALPTRLTYHESEMALTVYVNGDALTSNVTVLPWFKELCRFRRIATRNIPADKHSTELVQYLIGCGAVSLEVQTD